jgi:hypothetical protein
MEPVFAIHECPYEVCFMARIATPNQARRSEAEGLRPFKATLRFEPIKVGVAVSHLPCSLFAW